MLELRTKLRVYLSRISMFVIACLVAVCSLVFSTPPAAYADEENTLGIWGQYFDKSYEKVNAYHFALLYSSRHQVVPHLEGTTITYAIEDTSNWPDPDALNSTVLGIAADMWGGRFVLEQQASESEAAVVFRYGGATYQDSSSAYATTHVDFDPSDGALYTSGGTTEITVYGPWFDLAGAWLAWAGFGDDTDTRRARVIGHELGHEYLAAQGRGGTGNG
jgi:hypothetical protein